MKVEKKALKKCQKPANIELNKIKKYIGLAEKTKKQNKKNAYSINDIVNNTRLDKATNNNSKIIVDEKSYKLDNTHTKTSELVKEDNLTQAYGVNSKIGLNNVKALEWNMKPPKNKIFMCKIILGSAIKIELEQK
ncbi:hypothetical protein C2G38_2204715 [Gigaspora rosea]|uniref:Uncharacterized protein n=1 Tax=Gigaspora rosea TaxID=44941 RepID=A0A397UL38_9GLOM|nr:hypothetical protein C2G38_2204715 [Gigaspora rosea]